MAVRSGPGGTAIAGVVGTLIALVLLCTGLFFCLPVISAGWLGAQASPLVEQPVEP